MERDFLGMNTKESVPLVVVDYDSADGHKDEAHSGSAAMQWPFLNKTSTTPQSVSYNAGEGDRQKASSASNQILSPRFQPSSFADAFLSSPNALPVFVPQKYSNVDRQVVQPFPLCYPYQSQRMETFKAASHQLQEARPFPAFSHHMYPVSPSSGLSKLNRIQYSPSMMTMSSPKQQPFGEGFNALGADLVAGSSRSRSLPKPSSKTAQLTIFYDGSVTVYDDVPSEKAQEIMLLASKGSNPPSRSVNLRQEVMPPPNSTFAVNLAHEALKLKQPFNSTPPRSPCLAVSSPISAILQKGHNSSDASVIADDAAARKTVLPLTLTSQQEAAKTIATTSGSNVREAGMPRAIPQARKASLARFLERRKERIASVAPFPCNKISPEASSGLEANSFSSISSPPVNLVSNTSNRDDEGLPSTMLKM